MKTRGSRSVLTRAMTAMIITVLSLASLAPTPAPKIWYVNAKARGSGDGLSWQKAMKTVGEAIAAASAGDSIWVAKGTYYPNDQNDRDQALALKDGVPVYGGFAGNEKSLDKRNPAKNRTILSGDIGTPGVNTDNSHFVVYLSGMSSPTYYLDGFTITGAYTSIDPLLEFTGAGISFGSSGTLELRNCVVEGNQGFQGAGINIGGTASQTTIENCVIRNNTGYHAGGISSYGHLEIRDSEISGNVSAQDGGGIYAGIDGTSNVQLERVLFTGNSAQNGAAIYSGDGTFTAVNTTITANSASGKVGNAVFVNGGTTTLKSSSIYNNYAGAGSNDDSQVNVDSGSTLEVDNSIIFSDKGRSFSGTGTVTVDTGNQATNIIKGGCNALTVSFTSCNSDRAQDVNPLLGPLADNGGSLKTMAPLSGSPAIDAAGGGTPAADARGASRTGMGLKPDLGAVELRALMFTGAGGTIRDGWVEGNINDPACNGVHAATVADYKLRSGDSVGNCGYRAIIHFDTNGQLNAGKNPIQQVTLRIRRAEPVDVGDLTGLTPLRASIRQPSFGTATIQQSDYSSPPSVGSVETDIFYYVGDEWAAALVPQADYKFIGKNTTQFRLQWSAETNSNSGADYAQFTSAAGAVADWRPQLIVYYLKP